jgi:hypothetical protein
VEGDEYSTSSVAVSVFIVVMYFLKCEVVIAYICFVSMLLLSVSAMDVVFFWSVQKLAILYLFKILQFCCLLYEIP